MRFFACLTVLWLADEMTLLVVTSYQHIGLQCRQ